MIAKSCKACGVRKRVNEFYETGKMSRKTGKKLRHSVCKRCFNLRRKLSYRPRTMQGKQFCSDEKAYIKRNDPMYLRQRVRKALLEKGLKKS